MTASKSCPPCDADNGRTRTDGQPSVDYRCSDCGVEWLETPLRVEAAHLVKRVAGSLFGWRR